MQALQERIALLKAEREATRLLATEAAAATQRQQEETAARGAEMGAVAASAQAGQAVIL
jgi:hypothetical protein